jgi:hypothetical protein
MKKWLPTLLFAFNLYAIQINDKDIYLGDDIKSLDTAVFNIRFDSIINYKYVAYNKKAISNANGFHNIVIEATPISGIIYQISADDRIVQGYKDEENDIDSLKKMFNDITRSLKAMYKNSETISSDSSLPLKDFKKIVDPSAYIMVNDAMIIKNSFENKGFFIKTETVYIYRLGYVYSQIENKVKIEKKTREELIKRMERK